jgi:threonine/homoserine/homoserine lactone efflux protein
MDLDFIPPLAVFAFASAITPGPNNVMLMASGANYGVRRTVPHIAGIVAGFALLALLAGLGLAQVFAAHPAARLALTVVSVAYLLYLAFRIATAAPPPRADGAVVTGKPLTFLQAALFQWVNPKAWAGALTAITVYAPGDTIPAVLATVAVASAVGAPCNAVWAVMGQQLRHVLADRRRLRIFNWTMAALLVASLVPILL